MKYHHPPSIGHIFQDNPRSGFFKRRTTEIETTASYIIPKAYFDKIEKEIAFLVLPIIQAEPEKDGMVRVRLTSTAKKTSDRDRALFAEAFHVLKDSKQIYDANEKESLSLLLGQSLNSLSKKILSQEIVKWQYLILAIGVAAAVTTILIGVSCGALGTAVGLVLGFSPLLITISLSLLVGLAINMETKAKAITNINELKHGLRKITSKNKKNIPVPDMIPKNGDDPNPNPNPSISLSPENVRAVLSHTITTANSKPGKDEALVQPTLSYS